MSHCRRVVLLLCLGWLGIQAWWATSPADAKSLEAATSQAGVAATDNKVEKMVGGAANWQPCQVGDILKAGDKIRTGKDSTASLMLADQSVMRLAPTTELQIVDLTEQENGCLVRRFQLSVGRVFNDVTPAANAKSTYEVKGPNAVASVRGTAFEMDASSDDTDVKVFDGSVECLGHQPGAKGELVTSDPNQNQFRANRAGLQKRMAFQRENADHWQMENWTTRMQWRQAVGRNPKLLTQLTPATMGAYKRAYYRMSPEDREMFKKNRTQFFQKFQRTHPQAAQHFREHWQRLHPGGPGTPGTRPGPRPGPGHQTPGPRRPQHPRPEGRQNP